MLHFNFSPFPVLETERLVLRKINNEDTGNLHKLRSDPSIMQYIDRPLSKSENETRELLKKIDDALAINDGITWALTLKNENQLRGTVGFWRNDKENHRGEIGYMMDTQSQGKGFMNEALKAVLTYGFQVMKLHSVEANVNPGNIASIKLIEKMGFVQEAFFKEHYFFDGKYKDSAIYSLLERNFRKV